MITMKKQSFYFSLMACLAIVFCSCNSSTTKFQLFSPDGELALSVEKDSVGLYVYSLADKDEELISASRIGFGGMLQGAIPGADWQVTASASSHNGVWKPLWGKRAEVKDRYNEQILRLTPFLHFTSYACEFRLNQP